jgi:Fic family protein
MQYEDVLDELRGTRYSIDLSTDVLPKLERILARGAEIAARYKSISPKLETVIRQDPEFRAFQTYQSNQLELQGPSLAQTQKIIEELARDEEPEDLWDYSTQDNLAKFHALQIVASDSHIIDVLGQHQANILVERIAKDLVTNRPFVEADLRALNKFCIQNKLNAGSYRTHDRINIGQHFDDGDLLWFSRPPDRLVEISSGDVPDEIRQICEYISRPHKFPALAAAVAHAWFTYVHPFEDGNGRVARLIANLVLLRNAWPPITIQRSRRDEYLDALMESDSGGDISLLYELFVEEIDTTLGELEDERFWKKRYRLALQQNPEQRQVDWIATARRFIDEFRRELRPFGFSVERVSMPDTPTFVLLEQGEKRAATLFAKIRNRDRREIRVGIGFMSPKFKQIDNVDTTVDGLHDPPTIYFQERNFRPNADFPYVHRSESVLLSKEFTFYPGRESEVIVLYGKSFPSGFAMTSSEFAVMLARDIAELEFPGLRPQ